MSGPLALCSERLSPVPSATTTATPANAIARPATCRGADRVETDERREDERHPGRERHDQGGDTRGRVTLADVQAQVVADDDRADRLRRP